MPAERIAERETGLALVQIPNVVPSVLVAQPHGSALSSDVAVWQDVEATVRDWTQSRVKEDAAVKIIVIAVCVGLIGSVDTLAQPVASGRALSGKSAPAKPGQTLKECRNCPEMIVVPSGTFMMGSPEDEPERRESEVHRRVTIARTFAMGKTEVTWDQWEACVRDRWCDGPAVDVALRTNEGDGTPNKSYVDWGRDRAPSSASAGMTPRTSSVG